MRVYIQWALADPQDYASFDLTRIQQVRQLPRKGLPNALSLLDNSPGWLSDVVVQGVQFAGFDHLSAAFPADGSFEVLAWNDDPEDYPEGPLGQVWRFYPPAPDARHGGALNTRQSLTVYTDVAEHVAFWTGRSTSMGPVIVRPWAEFPLPAANVTLHGIWIPGPLYALHQARRSLHGWEEWIGG